MLTPFDKFLAMFSILSTCIGVAIIICYLIHIKIYERRIEESRRFCIQLEQLKAEKEPPCIPIVVSEQVRKMRKEFDTAFDELEKLISKENVKYYLKR